MTKERKPFARKPHFQLVLVILFIGMVWFSFGQNVLAPARQTTTPDRIGTLRLVSSIEGPEAVAQVSKLHGTTIKLATASIAEYSGNRERATLWVGYATHGEEAAQLLKRMVEGISRGGSPFGNMKRLTLEGHDVYQADGPGGQHFFYQSHEQEQKIVWLSVEAVDAMSLIKELVMVV